MIKKSKKLQKGPTWFEVILAAALSVALGVALGAAYLVAKPVLKVKEIPKDAPAGAIYYIEGVRDFNKMADIESKRKDLVGGESVSVEEGELNVLIGGSGKTASPAPAPGKPGDKAPPPADQKLFEVGSLNARIHGGKIQFSDTVTVNALGISVAIIVQATGTFSRHGSSFEFDPEVFYVGGCPVQRLPFVSGWAARRFLFTQPVPEDLAAAWPKLSDVSIEGSTLRLKMP